MLLTTCKTEPVGILASANCKPDAGKEVKPVIAPEPVSVNGIILLLRLIALVLAQ